MQYLNHKIYDFVQRVKKSSGMKTDDYIMPDDYEDETGKINLGKRNNVLFKRYEETNGENSKFVNEEELWLNNRLKQSKVNNFKKKKLEEEDGYVFENQIDFIKNDVLQEMDKKEKIEQYKKENPQAEIDELKQQLQLSDSEHESQPIKKVNIFVISILEVLEHKIN